MWSGSGVATSSDGGVARHECRKASGGVLRWVPAEHVREEAVSGSRDARNKTDESHLRMRALHLLEEAARAKGHLRAVLHSRRPAPEVTREDLAEGLGACGTASNSALLPPETQEGSLAGRSSGPPMSVRSCDDSVGSERIVRELWGPTVLPTWDSDDEDAVLIPQIPLTSLVPKTAEEEPLVSSQRSSGPSEACSVQTLASYEENLLHAAGGFDLWDEEDPVEGPQLIVNSTPAASLVIEDGVSIVDISSQDLLAEEALVSAVLSGMTDASVPVVDVHLSGESIEDDHVIAAVVSQAEGDSGSADQFLARLLGSDVLEHEDVRRTDDSMPGPPVIDVHVSGESVEDVRTTADSMPPLFDEHVSGKSVEDDRKTGSSLDNALQTQTSHQCCPEMNQQTPSEGLATQAVASSLAAALELDLAPEESAVGTLITPTHSINSSTPSASARRRSTSMPAALPTQPTVLPPVVGSPPAPSNLTPSSSSRESELLEGTAERLLREYSRYTLDDVQQLEPARGLRRHWQKSSSTPTLPRLPSLPNDKAVLETKRTLRLTYHRILGPPPIYQQYRQRQLVEQDMERFQLHTDPLLIRKRQHQRRATYQNKLVQLPVDRDRTSKARSRSEATLMTILEEPPQKLPALKVRARSATRLRAAADPNQPSGTSADITVRVQQVAHQYNLASTGQPRFVRRPRQRARHGCELLKELHDGALPSILVPPF